MILYVSLIYYWSYYFKSDFPSPREHVEKISQPHTFRILVISLEMLRVDAVYPT